MADMEHISICICTFRRPNLLKRLLDELIAQCTEGWFTYSVVVADNDVARSAEPVVAAFGALSLAGYASDVALGYRWWKLTGMAVHTGSGITGGTLVDYVRAYLGPRATRNDFSASPAHRLVSRSAG